MITAGLVLPKRLETNTEVLTEKYGRFVAEPFERGYGHTIGHSLRRLLLSSLEGAAVSSVRVKGALHEYSSIKGVREDVIGIILNLKQLRVKLYSDKPVSLRLKIKRSGEIYAKDFEPNSDVEILNPDLVLANLDSGATLEMDVEVRKGRGYVPAERLKSDAYPIDTIFVDALFSPVVKVNYEVESARVGQMTDYDKLIIDIYTDGSVAPGDALAYAAKILKDSLAVFITFDEEEEEPVEKAEQTTEYDSKTKELLSQPIDIIELSVRASNCLKTAEIKTIEELVKKTENELLAFKNFGKKSLDEIQKRLKEMGLHLGMNI